LDTINKVSLFDKTWKLMQVLSRLPHNTHAVSCVVTNNKNRYALFCVTDLYVHILLLATVYVHIDMVLTGYLCLQILLCV